MNNMDGPVEHLDTVVIGAGQAGLTVGYHLTRARRSVVILEAAARVGDAWRSRWDSLRLFTPARRDGLPGWGFPARPWTFPTKDEMADYLQQYAARMSLPVRTGSRVERLRADTGRFAVQVAGGPNVAADNVVLAVGTCQTPTVPAYASDLATSITALHSSEYKNQSQLQPGGVLVVGASNTGAELAIECAAHHETWLAGRHPGQIPFRIQGTASRLQLERVVIGGVLHRVLTTTTPPGRRATASARGHGGPLIRLKTKDVAAAGVQRVDRVTGVRDGRPILADGSTPPVSNVLWCTGFHLDLGWVDLPGVADGVPAHDRGVVRDVPGLYLVGAPFQYSITSPMIHGSVRDATHVAHRLLPRPAQPARAPLTTNPRSGR
ncbi:MAG: NAD(P)/FAD-dependent oxidoreductase [Humibacillus sp.]|nr:NAD(P)/FAD-dependent oxidoreductase [Humibacillus sp.]MDN5776277.1 NAD(P)/FAD-dependent oxidoreductase [Humibacillus sp.]